MGPTTHTVLDPLLLVVEWEVYTVAAVNASARCARVMVAHADLLADTDAALQPLGIAPEVRPYFPHLTLGRVREQEALDDLHLAIEELPTREFGTISPDRFVLFESTPTNSGVIYRKVTEFPFSIVPGQEPALAARTVMAGQV